MILFFLATTTVSSLFLHSIDLFLLPLTLFADWLFKTPSAGDNLTLKSQRPGLLASCLHYLTRCVNTPPGSGRAATLPSPPVDVEKVTLLTVAANLAESVHEKMFCLFVHDLVSCLMRSPNVLCMCSQNDPNSLSRINESIDSLQQLFFATILHSFTGTGPWCSLSARVAADRGQLCPCRLDRVPARNTDASCSLICQPPTLLVSCNGLVKECDSGNIIGD